MQYFFSLSVKEKLQKVAKTYDGKKFGSKS